MADFNALLDSIPINISFINSTHEEDQDDLPGRLTQEDIEYVFELLFRQINIHNESQLGGNPIRDNYVAIIHKDIDPIVRLNSIFISLNEYSISEGCYDNEIGCLFNIRFIALDDDRLISKESSALGKDVYNNIFFERYYINIDDVINLRCTL